MQMRDQFFNMALCASIVSSLLPSTAAAQAPNAPSLTGDIILGYLQRDVFLNPGRGLQKVKIGQAFTRAANTWGPPKRIKKRMLSANQSWIYQSDDGTLLILNGEKTIERITVTGKPNSQYQTVDGVRFGMTPKDVVGFYSGPRPVGGVKRLAYPRRGIAFDFKHGKLHSIDVHAPTAP